jgi:hypothetical protein
VISLAGIGFDILAPDPLLDREIDWLAAVRRRSNMRPEDRLFTLKVERPRAEHITLMQRHPPQTNATVHAEEGTVFITGESFYAILEPEKMHGELYRNPIGEAPLQITLRCALCCSLPLRGAVPFHSAAIVMNGRGYLFYGQSGAGKSTIAGLSPFPVLSDELNAVFTSPNRVRATGMVGTLDRGDTPTEEFPLAGLFQLHKEPELRLERLSPNDGFRSLFGVTIVPQSPPLWNLTIAALDQLSRSLPIYSMGWAPSTPPWDQLQRLLPWH